MYTQQKKKQNLLKVKIKLKIFLRQENRGNSLTADLRYFSVKGKCSFIRNMKPDGNLNLYKGRQNARNSKNEGKHKDFFPYAYSL